MQNVNTGLYRTFFLQAEAAGQFWGFVSVLPLFSLSKCEVPNFGPLYSKLGELNIQNSLACFTYNIPGTSSSNFIGFWGIDIWADFEGTRPSCTPVHSAPNHPHCAAAPHHKLSVMIDSITLFGSFVPSFPCLLSSSPSSDNPCLRSKAEGCNRGCLSYLIQRMQVRFINLIYIFRIIFHV